MQMNMKEKVPMLAVHLNQDVMDDYGLSHIQVACMISTAIQSHIAAQYHKGCDEYNIYVHLDEKYRNNREAFEELMILLPSSGFVSLKQLDQLEATLSSQTIYREN